MSTCHSLDNGGNLIAQTIDELRVKKMKMMRLKMIYEQKMIEIVSHCYFCIDYKSSNEES